MKQLFLVLALALGVNLFGNVDVNESGRVLRSMVSTINSSTAPLANGATFTGEWQNVEEYSSIIVAVKTDQSGAYYVDFSPDGVNADSQLTRFYNTPDIEAPPRFTVTRQWFRVRFVNDSGSDQTYLRLQTKLAVNAEQLNIPIDATMSRDYDSISVRPTDYFTEVGQGLRQGAINWNKWGYNTDVDSAAIEVIATHGGTMAIMTTADTLDVVSDSAEDDAGQTGALTILITGIDENAQTQTEIVTMDGTTPVTTVGQWLGVNRVTVLSSGSADANVGIITLDDTSNAVGVQASIPAGDSVTQQAIFHTSINSQMMIRWILINCRKLSGGTQPRVTVRGWSYSRVTDTNYEIFRFDFDTAVDNFNPVPLPIPFPIGGREVFYFTAETNTNDTTVGVRFSGTLIENADAD